MKINIAKTSREMGKSAAGFIAARLNQAIAEKGQARLVLSTGASQFEMFDALTGMDVEWGKVTMFHLDEYIGLAQTHAASFRKYLQERFVSQVNLRDDGEGDVQEMIAGLTRRITEAPIDVAVIGVGENAHIAFNDPPADFDTQESYIVVNLDERCKRQQVGEGWFAGLSEVPDQAISMTVSQMLKARCIVSVVPRKVKAEAVQNTLARPVTPEVPATILKTHADWNLYLDVDSASGFVSC